MLACLKNTTSNTDTAKYRHGTGGTAVLDAFELAGVRPQAAVADESRNGAPAGLANCVGRPDGELR